MILQGRQEQRHKRTMGQDGELDADHKIKKQSSECKNNRPGKKSCEQVSHEVKEGRQDDVFTPAGFHTN